MCVDMPVPLMARWENIWVGGSGKGGTKVKVEEIIMEGDRRVGGDGHDVLTLFPGARLKRVFIRTGAE